MAPVWVAAHFPWFLEHCSLSIIVFPLISQGKVREHGEMREVDDIHLSSPLSSLLSDNNGKKTGESSLFPPIIHPPPSLLCVRGRKRESSNHVCENPCTIRLRIGRKRKRASVVGNSLSVSFHVFHESSHPTISQSSCMNPRFAHDELQRNFRIYLFMFLFRYRWSWTMHTMFYCAAVRIHIRIVRTSTFVGYRRLPRNPVVHQFRGRWSWAYDIHHFIVVGTFSFPSTVFLQYFSLTSDLWRFCIILKWS